MSDQRHWEVDQNGPDAWSSSSSSMAAAAAVCYEAGCVLSTQQSDEAAMSAPTSFTFTRQVAFGYDNAPFRGWNDFSGHYVYDQRQATVPAATAHLLSAAVQPPAETYCDYTQPAYGWFPTKPYETTNLPQFQHGPGYTWVPSAGDDYVHAVQQIPFSQYAALSGCLPNGDHDAPHPATAGVHVKPECRSSSSATSSGVDGPPAGVHAAKRAATSPSGGHDSQPKQEASVSVSSDSTDADRDEQTTGRSVSNTSSSSVDLLSDAVCRSLRAFHDFIVSQLYSPS